MRDCVRCGKEIDVISKDPDKVFYCKKCSFEVLNINEEELFKEEKKSRVVKDNFYFYLLPGTLQFKMKNYLTSLFYMYLTYFIPLAWFVFFILIYSLKIENKLLLEGTSYFSIFIVLQLLFVYIKNAMEVKGEVNRT